MRHRGGGPRYARQNIKDAPITPQLVERILALVPPKTAPATTNVVPIRPQATTPLPAFKNNPRGASGTARKASSAEESTSASGERAATPAPQRRPARAPLQKVQKAAVIRRPAQQPAEEVKASPPPPPNFASPAGEKIRSGKDDVKAIGPDGPSQRKPVGAAVPSSPDRAEKPVATRTETSMPKPPQASAATSALSCPPRAEVAPLPKKPVMGWVERQMAEVAAAKAYLERRGFAVTRADRDAQIARWFLSGWRWPLTNSELIEAARRARAQEARA